MTQVKSLFTQINSLFTQIKSVVTHLKSVFTHLKSVFTHLKSLFTHITSVPVVYAFESFFRSLYVFLPILAQNDLSIYRKQSLYE